MNKKYKFEMLERVLINDLINFVNKHNERLNFAFYFMNIF